MTTDDAETALVPTTLAPATSPAWSDCPDEPEPTIPPWRTAWGVDQDVVREKLREARKQIADELNAKYRDGTIDQWDELAAGKVNRLLDSILANFDGEDVPISMDWPRM